MDVRIKYHQQLWFRNNFLCTGQYANNAFLIFNILYITKPFTGIIIC